MGLVVGMDVHKSSCTYVVKQWDQVVEGPRRIPTKREPLEALAARYPTATFVIEATAVHEWVHDALAAAGVDVFVCKPPKREQRRKKSDPEDAKRLAAKHQAGDLRRVHVPLLELRVVRDRVRDRFFLAGVRRQFRNHVQGYLARKDPAREKIPDDVEGDAVFTRRGRAGVVAAFPALDPSYRGHEAVDKLVYEAEKGLETVAATIPAVQRLTSIPGVGLLVGMALYCEIGDVGRFRTSEELVGYFGMDPCKDQSGDHEVDKHRTSKEGRSYVRGLMVQAAWVHVMRCPDSSITKTYHRLAGRVGKQKAIVATARRLLKVAYTVWKEDRDFTITGPALETLAGPRAGASA